MSHRDGRVVLSAWVDPAVREYAREAAKVAHLEFSRWVERAVQQTMARESADRAMASAHERGECEAIVEAVETWPELDRLRRLRAAIVWWPYRTCEPYCATRAGDGHACDCGWGNTNAARREARQLIGLAEDEVQP